eukprot:TRINITY_DN40003_c0_g1_i1.p1 TRINITY_DN40003_c0_g1~~TRINITY_DN40003_c0_g1_i1.p1  ORF type:complete len:722 (-),score=124.98 TRINITY_DN40003_c0_g1_i1:165-2330(-)
MARTAAQQQAKAKSKPVSGRGQGSRGRGAAGRGRSAAAKSSARGRGAGRGRGARGQHRPRQAADAVNTKPQAAVELEVSAGVEQADVGERAEPPRANQQSSRPRRSTYPPRGHYDVLQIPRASNPVEIREAYRRRALATHPDKGGRKEEFQVVCDAFEVLSDGTRRAEYDNIMQASGSQDGLFTSGRVPPVVKDAFAVAMEQRRIMRDTLTRLTMSRPREREKLLKGLSNRMLQDMAEWIKPQRTQGSRMRAGAANKNDSSTPGLMVDRFGAYEVSIAWTGLKLRTSKTFSLAEAIDWHITLTQLKATALARMRASELYIQPHEADYDKKVPPLMEEELHLGHQASPSMKVVLISTHALGKHRIVSPATTNLALCCDFRSRWKILLNKYRHRTEKDRKGLDGMVDRLKKETARMAAKDKSEKDQVESVLLQAIQKHLDERGVKRKKEPFQDEAPEPETQPAESSGQEASNQVNMDTNLDWRKHASLALEFRDMLGFNHEDTLQALEKLKASEPEQLEIARAAVRGKAAILFNDGSAATTPAPSPAVKRRRTSQSKAGAKMVDSPSEVRSGQQLETALRTALPHTSLRDWYMLRACARPFRVAVGEQAARLFKDFVYSESLFLWENRSVVSGRARPTGQQQLARRLTSFFASPLHSPLFQNLDLGSAPMAALRDGKLQQAIAKMPSLENVVFPNSGWATAAERQRFLSSLPPGASAWGKGQG